MAHLAKITGLSEGLVASTTGLSSSNRPKEFKYHTDAAVRSLRSSATHHARTNQFDVQDHLGGLLEKFAIRNREDLADALDARLKEFAARSTALRWAPEILALFLELADRPLEKARVEDLEALAPPPLPKELTWADIIAEEPLDEEGIWDDVDYAEPSSDEDVPVKEKRRESESSEDEALEQEKDDREIAQSFVVIPDRTILDDVRKGQFWNQKAQTTHNTMMAENSVGTPSITELQAIREALFIIQGLSSSLFKWDASSDHISSKVEYALSHTGSSSFHALLESLARIASGLFRLRRWVSKAQSVPLLQSFQAAVQCRIRAFDKNITALQKRYLSTEGNPTVSLVEVRTVVEASSKPFLQLADLIERALSPQHPFQCLEILFEQTNIARMTGEADCFRFFGEIFFECLQIYLRPIRKWMEHGEVDRTDNLFFVGIADKSTDLASLWHDRYTLRRDATGAVHAPIFLHPAADRIFTTGKSAVFLKELGHYEKPSLIQEPPLSFEAVCDDPWLISPFTELFEVAFEEWVKSKYSLASFTLRERLYYEFGLGRAIDALEHIYLSKNGSLSLTFFEAIFDKVDRRLASWNDRFLLTELAQGIFGSVDCVDAERLIVRTTPQKQANKGSIKALSCIAIDYVLPWPLLNILHRTTLPTYQKLFTLLLQLTRTTTLLAADPSLKFDQHVPSGRDNPTRARTLRLRHRLLVFATALCAHVCAALAGSAAELRAALTRAADVDALTRAHDAFVARVAERCLVSRRLAPILEAVLGVLEVGCGFGEARRRWDAGGNRLRKMQEQFDRLSGFVVSGLRGIGRAAATSGAGEKGLEAGAGTGLGAGEFGWDMLVERLEGWGEDGKRG
ncbi:Spc98 family-domain-containing protein [Lineolata rhizophorae]|uniref:Spindle pole body component n=1 Tax=Lineolata rhizophorae TaxID=578093 RepID=A0A6A6NVR6_9PEZI|nr:Spc98 family-domain-containing protein [Lineolata rhizophorae]